MPGTSKPPVNHSSVAAELTRQTTLLHHRLALPSHVGGCGSRAQWAIGVRRVLALAFVIRLVCQGELQAAEQPASPLPPEQEAATFHFADDRLGAELVASEPNVTSPVALAWDADGRLFVAEMIDYPTGPTAGQIRMLEDKDGDGRYETATVFADQLPFPNNVLPWNGGVLVTAAPNLWFLRDTDGDGRADERRVILTGFAEGNQQLRANGLFWGLDNWVYGANGRSDGEVRRPTDPASSAVSIRRRDFRFRPNTGEFEAIAGQSQFGTARDDWGNRFLSWNTIPIRHEVLEERYLNRIPDLATATSVFNIVAPGDTGQVFPLTPAPLVFNTESSSHFNALAGLTIYRGDALGANYRGNAFMGESLRNLVHRRVLEPNGVTFTARRGESGKEFLASSDPWFHPVNYATGPDGALYVTDFYRRFVEHPDYIPGPLRAQVPWRTGAVHGRIWRIKPTNTPLKSTTARPRLSRVSTAELVKYLGHPNGWWRDTAQRLLVERRDQTAIPLLQSSIINPKSEIPLARLHALWTLEGMQALSERSLLLTLRDKQPHIREHAVRLSESFLARNVRGGSPRPPKFKLPKALVRLANDSDARVLLRLALTTTYVPSPARLEILTALAQRGVEDPWQSSSIFASLAEDPWPFLKRLLKQEPRWLTAPTVAQDDFLEKVGELVGGRHSDADLAEATAQLRRSSEQPGSLMVLAGLADGLARGKRNSLVSENLNSTKAEDLRRLLAEQAEKAAAWAASPQAPLVARLAAVRVLAHAPVDRTRTALLGLLTSPQAPEVQAGAVRALLGQDNAENVAALFANWNELAQPVRRQLINATIGSNKMVGALLGRLEAGVVRVEELDASARQRLLQMQNPEFKNRIAKLIPMTRTLNRNDVVKSYEPALQLGGHGKRGAEFFAKACLVCHSVQGQGGRVGPDLSGVATRPKDALLVDVLDPSRQITPDFMSYTVRTVAGEDLSGLIASETAASVVLRRANEPDLTVLRRDIAHLQAEGKSPMPEGLEEGMTPQDMADLLEFLRQPDKALLPGKP